MKCRILIAVVFALLPFAARGQFYAAGDNPASTKWLQTQTPHYKIIYPKGMDSLARVYGRSLEKYYPIVGQSAGYMPGEFSRGKMPVMLHPFNANSNGSVAWAPKIMNLYTSPQAYSSEPMLWVDMLTIHEQRHYAQMQTGLSHVFRPFGYIFGEMFNGLVAGVWQAQHYMEGDAVVAETALSKSGRGRTADFLNYYMIAYDHGDFRTFWHWRLGSQRRYVPNFYSAGYLLVGGIRFRYNYANITGDFYRHTARRPYDVVSLNTVLKKKTGVNLKTAYREIADTLHTIWQEEIAARAPFMPSEQVVKTPSRYTEYQHLFFAEDNLYAIKHGKTTPARLVRIDSLGREKVLSAFSRVTGPLTYMPSTGRFYWSESVPSARWNMKVNSQIRYYNTRTGHKHSLTRRGRLFNPCPSPDETMLCTSQYFDDGRTGLTVIDAVDGREVTRLMAPDSLQLVESAWMDGEIYCSAISANGYGIYAVRWDSEARNFGGEWRVALAPQPVQISNFGGEDGVLHFASDRTGVQELYHFDVASGRLAQETSTRYGANDFVHSPDGKVLYFSAKRYEGNIVEKTPVEMLSEKDVDFSDIHVYQMAEELTRQEIEIATSPTMSAPRNDVGTDIRNDVEFSQPKPYRKLPHLLRIHSWAPVYFSVDDIMEMSGEKVYDYASLGATVLSQNDLGTAKMQAGYSAHKDPYNKTKWRHSGHFTFTYSGLYPVFEASLAVNDRGAMMYGIGQYFQNYEFDKAVFRAKEYGKPYVSGVVSLYIPFNFSRGGWSTGLIPKVTYNISNDVINTGVSQFNTLVTNDGQLPQYLVSRNQGENIIRQKLTGSLRFYTMRPTVESGVFPRWGFGAEVGASFFPKLGKYYPPMGYMRLYGYLPGIIPQQGLNLAALYQTELSTKPTYLATSIVNTAPRGIPDGGMSYISSHSTNSMKLTAQYGIPIYVGDVSLWSAFMYIRRLVLTPHFDYTFFGKGFKGIAAGGLFSAGATLAVDFESLFWLKFPFELGVTFSYNGGPSYAALKRAAGLKHPFYVGPVFSVSFQ